MNMFRVAGSEERDGEVPYWLIPTSRREGPARNEAYSPKVKTLIPIKLVLAASS